MKKTYTIKDLMQKKCLSDNRAVLIYDCNDIKVRLSVDRRLRKYNMAFVPAGAYCKVVRLDDDKPLPKFEGEFGLCQMVDELLNKVWKEISD